MKPTLEILKDIRAMLKKQESYLANMLQETKILGKIVQDMIQDGIKSSKTDIATH